ncbi:cadherin-like and PC-esterase domain-containing protein 1 [Ixodes scapularis]
MPYDNRNFQIDAISARAPQPCHQTRWCWRCLSVRDLLLLLCTFAMLSVYMSYRLGSLYLQDSVGGGLGDGGGGVVLQRNFLEQPETWRYQRDTLPPSRTATMNSRLRKLLFQENTAWSGRFQAVVSSTTAELKAIEKALNYITSHTPQTVVLVTDSRTGLQRLGGLGDGGGGVVLQRNFLEQPETWRYQRDTLPPSRTATMNSRLRKLLFQVEDEYLRPLRESVKAARVKGHKAVINRDLPMFGAVLAAEGWEVRAPSWFRRPLPTGPPGASSSRPNATADDAALKGNTIQQTEWTVLLCLSFSDGDSGVCTDTAELTRYQAVNRIPGLRNVLLRKDAFCNTMNDARKIPAVMRQSLVPLCFVLPAQYQQFLNVADALGFSAQWLLTPLAPGGKDGGPEAVDMFSPLGRARIQQASTKRAVVQQALPSPLLVHGQPVNVRVFVLVTSLSPLRAYVHAEGMVRLRSYRLVSAARVSGKRPSGGLLVLVGVVRAP